MSKMYGSAKAVEYLREKHGKDVTKKMLWESMRRHNQEPVLVDGRLRVTRKQLDRYAYSYQEKIREITRLKSMPSNLSPERWEVMLKGWFLMMDHRKAVLEEVKRTGRDAYEVSLEMRYRSNPVYEERRR